MSGSRSGVTPSSASRSGKRRPSSRLCREAGHRTGSTDMGDLSQVIPVLHPYMGGARGAGHAADYEIVDPHLAYVMPARAMAAMVVDLLWDGA